MEYTLRFDLAEYRAQMVMMEDQTLGWVIDLQDVGYVCLDEDFMQIGYADDLENAVCQIIAKAYRK